MAKRDNEFTVYLDDLTAHRVSQYQSNHNLTKSKAASELIERGLSGPRLEWEVAKVSIILAAAFAAVWYDVGAGYLAYAIMFLSAGVISMVIDRTGFTVGSLLGRGASEPESASE